MQHGEGDEMAISDLSKLAILIKQERDALLVRWREQVRQLPSARQCRTGRCNTLIIDLTFLELTVRGLF